MVIIDLPRGNPILEHFWAEYANAGFGPGTGFRGFRLFLQHHIPGAVVVGKQIEEFQLHFECEQDAVIFLLKYAK